MCEKASPQRAICCPGREGQAGAMLAGSENVCPDHERNTTRTWAEPRTWPFREPTRPNVPSQLEQGTSTRRPASCHSVPIPSATSDRGSSRPAANAPVLRPADAEMAPTCSAVTSICLRPACAIWRRQRARWGERHRLTAGRPSTSAPTSCCSCNAAAGRTTASSCTGPWRARAGLRWHPAQVALNSSAPDLPLSRSCAGAGAPIELLQCRSGPE